MNRGLNLFRRILNSPRQNESLVILGVLAVVLMMIVPMPTILLDFFMLVNFMLSIIIILTVMYTSDPLEFSVFPVMLLVTTVFGLSLNISSTRLILTKGIDFNGKVVQTFASFVAGGAGSSALVVGFIIFIIIIAVQFMVITKGSTRISEVAARFTLDALPVKQMAIDAELNSGVITEEEAKRKKEHLDRTSEFYGSMDGASKFVSGNVKVSIFITFINIVGGLIVGAGINGEPLLMAMSTYTSLTIGDGLVSQIPALMISVATGLVVARVSNEGSTLGREISEQFNRQEKVYWITAGFLLALSFIPGFPWYLMVPMSLGLGFFAYRVGAGRRIRTQEDEKKSEEEANLQAKKREEDFSPVVPVHPISLEVGYGLIPLVDQENGAELLERITRIRKETALSLGLVVPPIRIMDNMQLGPTEYSIKIKEQEVGKGAIQMGSYMAINAGGVLNELEGIKTEDPAFGLPALWVDASQREVAEREGYTVVDPPTIIATHLTEALKNNAAEILGRQEVQQIVDTLKTEFSAVVDEVTKNFTTGEIQKVLQALLSEQVSIRNIVSILESMSDYSAISKERGFLVEKVRQGLKRQLSTQHSNEEKMMSVISLSPQLEEQMADSKVQTADGDIAVLEPEYRHTLVTKLQETMREMESQEHYQPVLLCNEITRPLLSGILSRDIPTLPVLSFNEISKETHIQSFGEISL